MRAKTLAWLRQNLSYPARVTAAALLALLAARLLGLPEDYWAAISAIVVVQADFGSSLTMGWNRLAGTAIGATGGALLEYFGRTPLVFGLGVLGVGLVCVASRLQKPANRFAAVALAVVLLISHSEPAWVVALHRFLEVSMGILAGLALTAIWSDPMPAEKLR